MSEAAERVRTLLLKADNMLKNQPAGGSSRAGRVRAALTEARAIARDPSVDPRVRELVDRRLGALDALESGGDRAD